MVILQQIIPRPLLLAAQVLVVMLAAQCPVVLLVPTSMKTPPGCMLRRCTPPGTLPVGLRGATQAQHSRLMGFRLTDRLFCLLADLRGATQHGLPPDRPALLRYHAGRSAGRDPAWASA